MRYFTNPGSKIKPVRSAALVKGIITVKETGKENIQDYINSFEDVCNVASLVARATRDPSVLNQRVASYGDFTDAPKTYAEMIQKMIDVESNFNALPVEVRKKFDNNPVVWMDSVNDEDFMEKMGFVNKPVDEEVKAEEVKE